MSINLLVEETTVYSTVESWEYTLTNYLDTPLYGACSKVNEMTGEKYIAELYELKIKLEELYLRIN